MKYKKYLVLIVFMMLFSINTVNAYSKDNSVETEKYSEKSIAVFLEDPQFGIPGSNTSTEGDFSCDELIDQSVKDLLNEVLMYPKYIIPIIIILLGTIDFFKAVIASKADDMNKSLKTFIKRVIIGVLVFLVPFFINVIIWLANLAWSGLGYTTCQL